MALTQGDPLPDVNTKTTQTTTAPSYYTNYLSNLATAGNTATAVDPSKMVAGFDPLQTKGFGNVETAAGAYKPGLANATSTADTAAGGLTADNIQALMNPYTTNVVDEMGRLQQQNIQRNVLPGLKAAFAGTGGSGSQRFANATGQTMADMQANLTGQQQGALSSGYNQALQAALQNLQLQNQAAVTQGNLAGQEQTLGLTGAQAELNAGKLRQDREQALIDAPLKTATNAAGLLRGYNVPTSTEQKYTGPMPGAYSASPLQQIAGLTTLFASGAGGTSAAKGLSDWFKSVYPGQPNPFTTDVTNVGGGENLPEDSTWDDELPNGPNYNFENEYDPEIFNPDGTIRT